MTAQKEKRPGGGPSASRTGDTHTVAPAPEEDKPENHFDDPTAIEFYTILWRKFMRIASDETIELTYFNLKGKPVVAYCRSFADHVRLLTEAERSQDASGVYTIFNELHPGLYARNPEGKWIWGASRASDRDVTLIRAIYLDFDAKRPRAISSSQAERHEAYLAFDGCRTLLRQELGISTFATADSGNGYAIFLAIEPVPPSKETKARIERFTKAIASKFSTERADVDASVTNPARLCPAFGTTKRKGIDCKERPHRMTSICCPHTITPVPIEVLSCR